MDLQEIIAAVERSEAAGTPYFGPGDIELYRATGRLPAREMNARIMAHVLSRQATGAERAALCAVVLAHSQAEFAWARESVAAHHRATAAKK